MFMINLNHRQETNHSAPNSRRHNSRAFHSFEFWTLGSASTTHATVASRVCVTCDFFFSPFQAVCWNFWPRTFPIKIFEKKFTRSDIKVLECSCPFRMSNGYGSIYKKIKKKLCLSIHKMGFMWFFCSEKAKRRAMKGSPTAKGGM